VETFLVMPVLVGFVAGFVVAAAAVVVESIDDT
jgi:hypothetical protein